MKRFADKTQKKVSYRANDSIFLLTKNFEIERPSKKLDYKMMNSFEVVRKTNDSYEFNLSPSMKQRYKIFHPSLLRKIATDPLSGQVNQSEPSVIVKDDEQYRMDDILDTRKRYGKVQFKAKGTEYPHGAAENDLGYGADGFADSREIVKDFYRGYPKKPRGHPPPEDTVGRKGGCHDPRYICMYFCDDTGRQRCGQ